MPHGARRSLEMGSLDSYFGPVLLPQHPSRLTCEDGPLAFLPFVCPPSILFSSSQGGSPWTFSSAPEGGKSHQLVGQKAHPSPSRPCPPPSRSGRPSDSGVGAVVAWDPRARGLRWGLFLWPTVMTLGCGSRPSLGFLPSF